MKVTTTVVWFRKCLRVHDNVALVEASASSVHVIPLFVLDPVYWRRDTVGRGRMNFMLESLRDLDDQLVALGSKLIVLEGEAVATMTEVFRGEIFGPIDRCLWEDDPVEPYAQKRDAAVVQVGKDLGIDARALPGGHTLWDLRTILATIPKGPPTTMPQMVSMVRDICNDEVPAALAVPNVVPGLPPGATKFATQKRSPPALPTSNFDPVVRGGETVALERLRTMLTKDGGKWAAEFRKPQTASTHLSTTILSPYLKFGCLSARYFYHELHRVYEQHPKGHSKPPESLLGQLYFREMAYLHALAIGADFDKQLRTNPAVRYQIPWRPDADEFLEKWKSGRTGFPYIDACMRQLTTTGWMHHLGRHAVACFLTRGDLWITWEKGAAVFEEHLLDADWAINTFNWLALSGVATWSPPYFRVYNPSPDSKSSLNVPNVDAFIRTYVPELKNFPGKYLVAPWKAPIADQRKANCLIGTDYPRPCVDHAAVSKANMASFKAAIQASSSSSSSSAKNPKTSPSSGRKKPRTS